MYKYFSSKYNLFLCPRHSKNGGKFRQGHLCPVDTFPVSNMFLVEKNSYSNVVQLKCKLGDKKMLDVSLGLYMLY